MYSAYTLCLLVSVLAAVVSSFEIQGESSSSPKAGGGVYGVDVSSVVSTSSFQCLAGAGITSIVMRAYRSSGSVDTNACTTLNNAKAGGIPHRDAYLFPCPTCGTSAQKQISDMVNYLTGTCPSAWSGRLWLDIEGSSYWTGSYSSNKVSLARPLDSVTPSLTQFYRVCVGLLPRFDRLLSLCRSEVRCVRISVPVECYIRIIVICLR